MITPPRRGKTIGRDRSRRAASRKRRAAAQAAEPAHARQLRIFHPLTGLDCGRRRDDLRVAAGGRHRLHQAAAGGRADRADNVRDALVAEEIVVQRARAEGLAASDEEINAFVHTMRAFQEDGRFTRRQFERALQLNPGYGTAHYWYSYYFVAMGRLDDAARLLGASCSASINGRLNAVENATGAQEVYGRRSVRADATLAVGNERRGLSREIMDAKTFTRLWVAALGPPVVVGVLISENAGYGYWAVALFALGAVRARHPQRETPAGLEAASHWLGVRAKLEEDEVFPTLPPVGVL